MLVGITGYCKRLSELLQYYSASTVWFVSERSKLRKTSQMSVSYAAAWYDKTNFTISDAIVVIRCEIYLSYSPQCRECNKNPLRKFRRLLYALLLHCIIYKVELRRWNCRTSVVRTNPIAIFQTLRLLIRRPITLFPYRYPEVVVEKIDVVQIGGKIGSNTINLI